MAAPLLFALLSVVALRPAGAQDAREYLKKTAGVYKQLTSLQVEAITERSMGEMKPTYYYCVITG